jgi:hypothetical protein
MKRRGFIFGSAAVAAAPFLPALPTPAAELPMTVGWDIGAGDTTAALFGGDIYFLGPRGLMVYRGLTDAWAHIVPMVPETQAKPAT